MDVDDNGNEKVVVERPAMRLVSLSMVGRAEGVIHAMKPDYGFIYFVSNRNTNKCTIGWLYVPKEGLPPFLV